MSTHSDELPSSSDKVEADVSPRLSILIWSYLFAFVVVLFLSMGGLTIYFRYELEKERYTKVESKEPEEKVALRQNERLRLSGQQVMLEGKKQITIDEAITRFAKMNEKR